MELDPVVVLSETNFYYQAVRLAAAKEVSEQNKKDRQEQEEKARSARSRGRRR